MTRYRKKPVEVEAWQVGTEPVPFWAQHLNLDDIPFGSAYLVCEDSCIYMLPEIVFDKGFEVVE